MVGKAAHGLVGATEVSRKETHREPLPEMHRVRKALRPDAEQTATPVTESLVEPRCCAGSGE
jgi:hypothetical protein